MLLLVIAIVLGLAMPVFAQEAPLEKNQPLWDMWGWHLGLNYQREESIDLDYLEQKVFEKGYKAGSNYVNLVQLWMTPDEFNGIWWCGPGATEEAWARSGNILIWSDDDPLKRPEGYVNMPHHYWNRQTLLEAIGKGHDYGYLAQVSAQNNFIFRKKVDGQWKAVAPHWCKPEEVEDNLLALKWTSSQISNPLESGWRLACDGYQVEHWFSDNKGLSSAAMWEYNPGASLEWHMYPSVSSPAPNFVFQWGYAFPGSTTVLSSGFLNGPFGRRTVGLQTSTRAKFYPPYNTFGGFHPPDFFLQQICAFLRPKMAGLDKGKHITYCFGLGESLLTCPQEKRRYFYAVNLDPIRGAVTTSVTNQYNQAAQAYAFPDNLIPAETPFIQNRYFRLYPLKDRDGGILQVDTYGLANFSKVFTTSDFPVRLSETTGFLVEHAPGYYNCEKRFSRHFLHPVEKKFTYEEIGGYRAVLREDRVQQMADFKGGYTLEETRRYVATTDSPYFLVNVERRVSDGLHDITTTLNFDGYDKATVGDSQLTDAQSFDVDGAKLPVIALHDSRGRNVDLTLIVLDAPQLSSLDWYKDSHLNLNFKEVESDAFAIAVVFPDFMEEGNIEELSKLLRDEGFSVSLGAEGEAEIANPYNMPIAAAVRVEDADDNPYFVRERGWWLFRGAQPSLATAGQDFVKVYLEPKETVAVARYGYLGGVVKPGWGCQYTVALKDPQKTATGGACEVRVLSVTPLLFAPRVEFAETVSSVQLDGKPWHYFDEKCVFLPNKTGTHSMEVAYGEPQTPHVTRTFAMVEATELNEDGLTVDAKLPVWTKELPGDLKFTAAVKTMGRKVKEVRGGETAWQSADGALVRFLPGQVTVVFQN